MESKEEEICCRVKVQRVVTWGLGHILSLEWIYKQKRV